MINNIGLIRHRILITESLNAIKCLSSMQNIYRDSAKIARTVNLLGDKLKIYTRIEKNLFLQYLHKSNDVYERELNKELLAECDGIVVEYEKFRRKYNTGTKISSDVDGFKRDAQKVISLLEKGLTIKKVPKVS